MIRPIELKDAKCIQEISKYSLGYDENIEVVKRQIEKISKDKDHHFIYVYEDEYSGEVIGFVHAEIYESIYIDTGFNILGLAVSLEHHGKGIGKKLMQKIEELAIKKDAKYIRLNSSTKRTEAHKFYENMGYDGEKTQKRFIKNL